MNAGESPRAPTQLDEHAVLLAAKLMENRLSHDDGLVVQKLWAERRFLADILRTIRNWESLPAKARGHREMDELIRDMLRSVGEE